MSWPMVPLGEVASIVSGATPKTGVDSYWDGEIPWATPADLSRLDGSKILRTSRNISEAGLRSCAAVVLPVNSVLLSSRAPIGHVAINAVPMATNQGFKSLVPRADVLDPGYLYHWLQGNRAYLNSLGNGATFKEISKAVVQRVEIPLPPLGEQRRIATILDHAESLRMKRHASMGQLQVLQANAFLKIFGDPATWPNRHVMGVVGDLVESARYGTSAKAGPVGSMAVLRMGNITTDGRIDATDLKFMELSADERERYTVRRGDVLFNRTNSADLVGKTAVVKTDKEYAYAGYLIRLRMAAGNEPDFLSGYLNSRHGKAVLRGMCKSIVGQANINAKELQSIRIAIPSVKTQKEYSRVVDAVERKRRSLLKSQYVLDEVLTSLQSRAFSGEL